MKRASRGYSLACAAFALISSGTSSAEGYSAFDLLVQSQLVHCAFYKEYEIDAVSGNRVLTEGRSNSLTHFRRIRDDHAAQISTRMAGSRQVRVIRTDKHLHFIDQIAGMYLLTTVYGCIERDPHGVCLTYGSTQSRHFDPRVLYDPDAVYEALKSRSDPGFCDHSFINVKAEATAP